MEHITSRLPEHELKQLDQIVKNSNHFDSRAQAIRYAVREMMQREGNND